MLKDLAVRSAKPADRPYKLSDGGGLYLCVSPTGGKLWRWNYRFAGARKTMAVGKYPDVSLSSARERHGEGCRVLATGVDPMAQRKQSRHSGHAARENAFAVMAGKWLDHWQPARARATSIPLGGV